MSDPHASHHAPPPPPEPNSPMWLPALGLAIFVVVGIWWAVTSSATDAKGAAGAASASASAQTR